MFFQHKDDWAHTTTCTTMLGKDTSFCLVASKGLINYLIICIQAYSKVIYNSIQHISFVNWLNPSLQLLWMGWKFKGLLLTKAGKKKSSSVYLYQLFKEKKGIAVSGTSWITSINNNSHRKWKMMTKLEPSVTEGWNPGIEQWITLTWLRFLQKMRVFCSFYYLPQGLIC